MFEERDLPLPQDIIEANQPRPLTRLQRLGRHRWVQPIVRGVMPLLMLASAACSPAEAASRVCNNLTVKNQSQYNIKSSDVEAVFLTFPDQLQGRQALRSSNLHQNRLTSQMDTVKSKVASELTMTLSHRVRSTDVEMG